MNVIVLGAGLVGAPMAHDLALDPMFNVTVCDLSQKSLDKFKNNDAIKVLQADLSDTEVVKQVIKNFDLVLSAVPGFMGFQTLQTIIETGKHVVDIAFFPEDMFTLDALAKDRGVVAISDMGVAPGMSNLLVGYADFQLDETDKVFIYVGGLPKIRQWPYEYKAVFSPVDVIEEYTRPARYVEHGQEVIKPALSDPELLNFEHLGTLEAFNSDGLRTLANTIKGNYMIEKTLRYPGHIEIMRILRETGFFDKNPVTIKGVSISPLEFTSSLLFPKWQLKQGDEDITIMKIIVEGKKEGKQLRYTYDLFDTYNKDSGVHSMARTTGYSATMALRMVAKGLYTHEGVSAPEFIGRNPDCVNFILDGLKERGVIYTNLVEGI